jgi:diguanylate cyclase (GGDEF)-like protein
VQERLSQEVARASRAARKGVLEPLSLVLFDLTDFKIFNDTYGHGVGDEVLRATAQCLKQNFRAGDIVARYGGDEFLALMPETDFLGAQALCARIIQAIESQRFEAGGQSVQIRTACGIAVYPDDGNTPAELLRPPIIVYTKPKGAACLW